ncbi:Sensor histidine kinase YpdA [compost metagenome]
MVQPLVENAVLHGIESGSGGGQIRIYSELHEHETCVVVEDSGKGMTEEAMVELRSGLDVPMDQEMGCGLWNVQQRMRIRYGDSAGLRFSRSEMGGVKVTLHWPNQLEDMNNKGELT